MRIGLALAALIAFGCHDEVPSEEPPPHAAPAPLVVGAELHPAEPHLPSFDGGPIEFVHETFQQLYPIFCIRHSMPLGEKAALWQKKYFGKWVRWTGKILSFTPNGITIKQGWQTVTFDISLWLERDQLDLLRSQFKVGDVVTYIGRLDSYDDIWLKLYLTHGSILAQHDPIQGRAPWLPPLPTGVHDAGP